MSEGVFNALSEPEESEGGVSEVKNNGHETPKEEAWIVSTKTRRLAPAFTLSRKDLGADSSRNAAASAAASAAHDAAALKKKGTISLMIHCSLPLLSIRKTLLLVPLLTDNLLYQSQWSVIPGKTCYICGSRARYLIPWRIWRTWYPLPLYILWACSHWSKKM